MIAKIANLVTIVIVALVYAIKTIAYLYPWRGINRLRISLALTTTTWTVLWTDVLLQSFRIAPTPSPTWFLWLIRFCLIVFGVGNIVELFRAGALRRPKEESDECHRPDVGAE